MKKYIIPGLVLAVLSPLLSFAHNGHGHTEGFTIIHYFTEPAHLVPELLVATIAALSFRWYQSRKNQS